LDCWRQENHFEQQIKAKNHLRKCYSLWSTGTEKEDHYKNVSVHPSRNEGLPLSVLEVAIAKTKVVTDATNIVH
jgi:hypothetical protein